MNNFILLCCAILAFSVHWPCALSCWLPYMPLITGMMGTEAAPILSQSISGYVPTASNNPSTQSQITHPSLLLSPPLRRGVLITTGTRGTRQAADDASRATPRRPSNFVSSSADNDHADGGLTLMNICQKNSKIWEKTEVLYSKYLHCRVDRSQVNG